MAVFCFVITIIMSACNQQTPPPAPQPQTKTTIYIVKGGGGNDSTTSVTKSYEKTTTDTMGVMRTSGKTTAMSVTKKAQTEMRLVVTDSLSQIQAPVPVTTTTNTSAAIPWWGWLLIGICFLLLLALFYFLNGNRNASASAHATVINPGCDINVTTRTAMYEREQAFRDRTMGIIDRAADRGNLKGFSVLEDEFTFAASARFFKPGAPSTNTAAPAAADKPADQKPS